MAATQTSKTADRKSGETTGAELSAELDALRAEITAATERLAQLGIDGLDNAKARSRQAKDAMLANGEAIAGDLSELHGELDAKARKAIVEKPMQSVLIAAGIGLLAGYLMRR